MEATTQDTTRQKRGRPSRSIDEEIQAARERLLELERKKKERDAAERERNRKAAIEARKRNERAVIDVLTKAGLLEIDAAAWQASISEIRATLERAAQQQTPAAMPDHVAQV